jgi:DNA repair protein RecN (Recombination protein N)
VPGPKEEPVLRELSAQNLALIEDVRVVLRNGFCVWTGETGAGKSLLLAALGLVLGEKASPEWVRAGCAEGRAAAVFELGDARVKSDIEEILGGPLEHNQLIVIRRISAQGRSSAHANGLPVTIAALQALGERLVDFHGQHESRALVNPAHQRALLDDFGRLDDLRSGYSRARETYHSLLERRRTLLESAQIRDTERALLAFEREELAGACPRIGEFESLNREARRRASAEGLRAAASAGVALLHDDDRSAQDLLANVARRLQPYAESVPQLAEAKSQLERLAAQTREVAHALSAVVRDCDVDPARLEEVETRLALYRRLATRYRCAPDDLAQRLAEMEQRLARIERNESDLRSLDAPLAQAWDAVKTAVEALSTGRERVCRALSRAVQKRLKLLGLGDARLVANLVTEPLEGSAGAPAPPESGLDRVELEFAPNPGEPLRPLRRTASGGELSRVTLAIKIVLAVVDRMPTLVLDEIDSGVGGRLGRVVGETLAELGRHHQVICVTHLPQVASYAQHHWAVRKHADKRRTRTTITLLNASDRVRELAAMLRGDSAASGTEREARAMLNEAQEGR